MKLKGRLGASLTLVLVLSTTVGLFYYALQFRKDSLKTLQLKLREMELQRLEEEKGKQSDTAAQKAAERWDQFAEQIQKRAEALADSGPLRQPHDRPAWRRAKEKEFLRAVRGDSTWSAAVLTDESGGVVAGTGTGPEPLGGTPEFLEVSRQRMTTLRTVEHKGRDLSLQVTVPCLSNTGGFLGVLQAETALTPAVLDRMLAQGRLVSFLGTSTGRRLTPVPLENFPNNLGTFMNKDLREMEAFLNRTGGAFFKVDWGNTHYLAGSAETRIRGVRVFTLLEVGGLEKLVGADSLPDNLLSDPVLLGGLMLILLAGLFLIFILGGSESGSIAQLNRELGKQLQEEETQLAPIGGPAGAEWQKLTDYVNILIERASGNPVIKAPAVGEAGDPNVVASLKDELTEVRQIRDQIAAQNQELRDKLEAASLQNQQWREVAEKAESRGGRADRQQEESSQLRIDAIVNMSDDLKATLTVIKNYISSILSSEEGKITDAQQEFLGVVINKSARLERQINDLLDLSHLENEAAQMFMVPTDITAMVQDVILNAQPQADTKQVRLIQDIPASLSRIMVNGDRLGQVLVNLVQHALRITPVGGEVRIEIREMLSEQILKIVDGGTALNAEQAEIIFNHFHGLDSRAGTALSGSGLRFAIMQEIVTAHRGTLAVHGLPDGGNEMVIALPLGAEAAGGAAAQSSGAAGPGENIKAGAENEAFFDLSAFMQEQGTSESPRPSVPGGGEELDELLKNIEDVNRPKEP